MTKEAEELLTALEQATDHVIQLIVDNNTAELESGVIRQVQMMKKLASVPQDQLDKGRLEEIKRKIEQQQLLINQALEVSNLFLQAMHELSNFNRMG